MHVPEGKHHPHQHQEQEMAKPKVKTKDSRLDMWGLILIILKLFKALPPVSPVATQGQLTLIHGEKSSFLSDS